jgi:hypothetical protein
LTAIATGRIALYRSWFPNEDEGWTRWLLEQHEFRFATITDADIRGGNLKRRYDAILLPSASAAQMLEGQPAGTLPAEYTGGLGQPGVAALRAFVEAGGTLICLDQACRLPIEEFGLPVRDITARPGADAFFCPGSILALEFDALQPAGYGMRPHSAAFFASSSAFDVSAGAAGIQVDARYASQDLLISGWLEGGQLIAGQPAIVEVKRGAGRVVLLGFPVQHRGQTHATFRFLFNAIFTSGS